VYVVRNKKSKKILHINPAPLSQKLDGTAVFHGFDPKKMEIGRWEGPVLPEHFEIDKKGRVVEFSLPMKVKKGLVELEPHQKIEKGEIVDKSLAEQVKEGLVSLSPTQKIVGEGPDEEIVEKSVAELAEDGVLSREEVHELAIQRLRGQVAAHFQRQKTRGGYRLDDLARQKASFSAPFRHLPKTDERKKELLAAGLIYPDDILDEILDEVAKIQTAYRAAKKAVTTGFEKSQPVEKWASISLQDHMPDARKKRAPKKTAARKKKPPKKTPSTKKASKTKTPKRGS